MIEIVIAKFWAIIERPIPLTFNAELIGKVFRAKSVTIHPDKGGNTIAFQEFSNLHDTIQKHLKTEVNGIYVVTEWVNMSTLLCNWASTSPPSNNVQSVFKDFDKLLYILLDNRCDVTFRSEGGIKKLSHYGAIKLPDTAHRDWAINASVRDGVRYIDPGNHIYAISMVSLIFANLMPMTRMYIDGSNNEKYGDYIECILGTSFANIPKREQWGKRINNIIILISKLVSTFAQFDRGFNEWPPYGGLIPGLAISSKSILANLGVPLNTMLDFWNDATYFHKTSDALLNNTAQPPHENAHPARSTKQPPPPPQQPPPPPVVWRQLLSIEHNAFYYWNVVTQDVMWVKPAEPCMPWTAPLASGTKQPPQPPQQPPPPPQQPPPPPVVWRQLLSIKYNTFYYWNVVTQDVIWAKPADPCIPWTSNA
jgi:hypothetical protein